MSRISTVFLIIFFSLPFISHGQSARQDSSLQDRNIHQQLFVLEYVKANEPENGFESPDRVLTFMQGLSDEWSRKASGQSESYRRLNTYVPMWAVHSLFSNPLPQGAQCLIYSEFSIPSFVRDVEFLGDQLESEGADLTEAVHLIRMANLDWAVTQRLTYSCDLESERWENLKNAAEVYPGIVQRYLDAEALPGDNREEYRKYYRKVQATAESARDFIRLRDRLYRNERSDVFAELAAKFPDSGNNRFIHVEIGIRLFQQYVEHNETDLALATLDLLARNTSEESLSRNELHRMFTTADPRSGPTRFESVTAGKSLSSLTVGTRQKQLSGEFFDARSGENIRFPLSGDRLLVLDFWSMSCGPCIDEIPELNKLAAEHADEIILISINNDPLYGSTKEELQQFVADHDIQYPVILDTPRINLMEQFEVYGWPARFLVNRDGYFYMEPVEKRVMLSLREIKGFLMQE